MDTILGLDRGTVATLVIGAAVFGAMALVLWRMWRRRQRGLSASGCSGCAQAGSCGAYVAPGKGGPNHHGGCDC